jgi:tetratricopeptide (TPR) repeat protein
MEVDKWFVDKTNIAAERKQSFEFDNFGLSWPTDPHLSPQQFLSRNAGKTYHELFREAQIAHNQGNYEDEIALWNDVVAMNTSAVRVAPAVMNRGSAYSASGDLDRALQDYNEAIRLDPRNAGAYVNRALALAHKGDVDAAMIDYAKAIALNPRQWQAYFNRAAELRDVGQLREAVDDLTKVMELNPEFTGAYMNRADIYVRQGELDKALADYNIALVRDPKVADVYVARANLFIGKKSYQQAVRDLQTAIQMNTKKPERVLNSLAWLRATCPEAEIRNGKEAVELALKACELSQWNDWNIIDTLAAAYAEQGDFDRAIKYQKQVLEMGKFAKDNDKIRQHLALYEQHTPYRQNGK